MQDDSSDDPTPERVAIARTRAWLEHAVIGLNLCPFAKAVVARRQVRFVVSEAAGTDALRASLSEELALLAAADPAQLDTTLLVCTQALHDFDDYNQFLDEADGAVRELDLEGVLQVASFHPGYRFAGTGADELSNATNRSPYPTLQLLREASVERAVAATADTDAIYEANIEILRSLGEAGWRELSRRWT